MKKEKKKKQKLVCSNCGSPDLTQKDNDRYECNECLQTENLNPPQYPVCIFCDESISKTGGYNAFICADCYDMCDNVINKKKEE